MEKKCYEYTRVSTIMQVEGYSLEAQQAAVKKYADYANMKIVREYRDEGKSGKSAKNRPEFEKMIEDILDGKDNVSYVLVYKLSRFGRNAADILYYLQLMQDNGVNLYCVEENIDSGRSGGKLIISVLSAVAEIERENIAVQTFAGRKQKAQEGKWNGGQAPFGYSLENGVLKINEEEAATVRIIFDKFVKENIGAGGIAKYLNNMGIKKPIRGNTKLEKFSVGNIKKILDNEVYFGKIPYCKRKTVTVKGDRSKTRKEYQKEYMLCDGQHEGIVSEEIWNLAHKKRLATGVKREKVYDKEHEHILSSILRCPVCGSPLYGNRTTKRYKGKEKTHYYYMCKNRRTVSGHTCTYNKNLREEKIDSAVVEVIKNLVNNERFAEAIKSKINAKIDTSNLDKEISQYKEQLKEVRGALGRIEKQLDGTYTSEEEYSRLNMRYSNKCKEVDELNRLIAETELKRDNIQKQKVNVDNIYKYLIYFEQFYDQFTDGEKKRFFESFVERIDLFEEEQENGRLLKHIKFKFPVFYNGEYVDEIGLEKNSDIETVCLLSRNVRN